MSEQCLCPDCGSEIAPDAPEGLCRKCLLKLALQAPACLHLRCPHCHNPVELVDDIPLEDVECPSCGSHFSMVTSETATYAGGSTKSIGHFELLAQVGTGHFGSVWKARDTELDRTVALKIPRKGQLDVRETQQLLREARAAAQIRHPNIVSVHEVGLDGDSVFIVSDFVDGASLSEWLKGHRLTPTEAAEMCVKIAYALHAAHEAGVVHRDLKPANIMLDARGEPYLTDFGLAKREAGEITMTAEGKVLGTPAYMSPEQARGEAHRSDRRTDVYSLGVILYQLLTGELPFRGESRMLIVQILHDEPTPPRKFNSWIPRDLETICLKCLEKPPERRYASAESLAEDLERWLAGEPIHSRSVSGVERFWRRCKRNPVVSALLAAVVLVAAVGLAGVISQWKVAVANEHKAVVNERKAIGNEQKAVASERKARDNAAQAREKAQEATQQRDEAERQRDEVRALNAKLQTTQDELRHTLYVSDMKLAQRAWDDANIGVVLDLLERHKPQGDQEDLRSFEWYYWDRLCHSGLFSLKAEALGTHGPFGVPVVFSPDGRRLASAAAGTLRIWDTTTGRQTVPFDGSPSAARSLGAKRELLSELARALIPQPEPVRFGGSIRIASAAFSPDGRRLATADDYGMARVWDAATGKEAVTLERRTSGASRRSFFVGVASMAFSPDGSRLASAGGDGSVWLWDTATGRQIFALIRNTSGYFSVAFSPDGRRLASTAGDGAVELWDTTTGQETLALKGHTGGALVGGPSGRSNVAFSSDGTRLVASARDGVNVWDASPWKKSASTEVAQLPGQTRTDPKESQTLLARARQQMQRAASLPESEPAEPQLVWQVRQLATELDQAQKDRQLLTALRSGRWKRPSPGWQDPRQQSPYQRSLRSAGTSNVSRRLEITTSTKESVMARNHWMPLVLMFACTSVWARYAPCLAGEPNDAAGASKQTSERATAAQKYPASKRLRNSATGHEYQRLDVTMSWSKAKVLFEELGGHLATATSSEENSYIFEHFGKDHVCWLGTGEEVKEGTWKWVTREPFQFTNWASGEPSGGSEHYLAIGLGEPYYSKERLNGSDPVRQMRETGDSMTHYNRASTLRKQGKVEEAIAEYREMVRLRPNESMGHLELALALRAWNDIEAGCTKALELEPEDHLRWYRLAPIRVFLGDEEGYRRLRRDMLARWGQTQDATLARYTAKACLILPVQGEDLNTVVRLADTGASSGQSHWTLFVQGMAYYRAGKLAAAVERLEASLKPTRERTLHAQARSFLAMAHYRQDRKEEAKKHLEATRALVYQACQEVAQEEFGRFWYEWLLSLAVYAEAAHLVEGADRQAVLAQLQKEMKDAPERK